MFLLFLNSDFSFLLVHTLHHKLQLQFQEGFSEQFFFIFLFALISEKRFNLLF